MDFFATTTATTHKTSLSRRSHCRKNVFHCQIYRFVFSSSLPTSSQPSDLSLFKLANGAKSCAAKNCRKEKYTPFWWPLICWFARARRLTFHFAGSSSLDFFMFVRVGLEAEASKQERIYNFHSWSWRISIFCSFLGENWAFLIYLFDTVPP